MSGFLRSLAERAIGRGPVLRLRARSHFEPLPGQMEAVTALDDEAGSPLASLGDGSSESGIPQSGTAIPAVPRSVAPREALGEAGEATPALPHSQPAAVPEPTFELSLGEAVPSSPGKLVPRAALPARSEHVHVPRRPDEFESEPSKTSRSGGSEAVARATPSASIPARPTSSHPTIDDGPRGDVAATAPRSSTLVVRSTSSAGPRFSAGSTPPASAEPGSPSQEFIRGERAADHPAQVDRAEAAADRSSASGKAGAAHATLASGEPPAATERAIHLPVAVALAPPAVADGRRRSPADPDRVAIHIGRIEVRAAPPPPATTRPAPPPIAAPQISLDAYLQRFREQGP
jgi:hypothetical protein